MNNEVKSLWVSALRSGEYNKAVGVLCKTDLKTGELCFCALGVLCNLWHNTVGEAQGSQGWQYHCSTSVYKMDECTGALPPAVRDWAELPWTDPKIEWVDGHGNYREDTVSELNDTYSKTFSEIADLIEKYL